MANEKEWSQISLKKKRIMLTAGICFLLFIAGYLFRPQRIDQLSNASLMDITVTINSVEGGQAIQHLESYQLEAQDDVFADIQQTLSKYTYHANFATFVGRNAIEGNSYTLLISGGDDWMVITDKGLLINSRVYRAGYWGYSVEEELVGKILKALSANTPIE